MNIVEIVTKSSVLDVTVVLDPAVTIRFMLQLECSSKRSQIDYSNAPEKMQNNYEVKNRTANLILGEISFTERFRIQGKEKQKIHFPSANMNKEKV